MIDTDNDRLEISCCACARQFEAFAPTQASGCAADVGETGITGHYGSTIADLNHFHFKAGKPPRELAIDAQVCDDCIQAMLDNGVLDPEPDEYTPFADVAPVDLSDYNLVIIEEPADHQPTSEPHPERSQK